MKQLMNYPLIRSFCLVPEFFLKRKLQGLWFPFSPSSVKKSSRLFASQTLTFKFYDNPLNFSLAYKTFFMTFTQALHWRRICSPFLSEKRICVVWGVRKICSRWEIGKCFLMERPWKKKRLKAVRARTSSYFLLWWWRITMSIVKMISLGSSRL